MKNDRKSIGLILGAVVFVLVSSLWMTPAMAVEEETIVGMVVKTDRGIIVEADDGDYLVKGKDLSGMVGKMVEVTGIITDSDKGETIEVKSVEEIKE
ncbi:MAG: hypothetical protein KBH99_01005 [Syntrophobacteraceae bacterium]|nr:hypothetical protein [Syntrophobacteraceae bacterium]